RRGLSPAVFGEEPKRLLRHRRNRRQLPDRLMRSVTYSMGVSLDGYIVGPDGSFDWTAPDEEFFGFVTDEIRQVGVHLLGRRLYETMLYWETADQDPSLDDSMLEGAAIWKRPPEWVSSPRRPRV